MIKSIEIVFFFIEKQLPQKKYLDNKKQWNPLLLQESLSAFLECYDYTDINKNHYNNGFSKKENKFLSLI